MIHWRRIFEAAEKGDLVYLKDVQPYVDFTFNIETLFRAVMNGHINCVCFLLPLSNLKEERGEIVTGHTGILLQTAVRNNDHRMVETLLPHCNPKLEQSMALQYASCYGDMDMVNLLYAESEPHSALLAIHERIERGFWEPQAAELLTARLQNTTLLSQICAQPVSATRKL